MPNLSAVAFVGSHRNLLGQRPIGDLPRRQQPAHADFTGGELLLAPTANEGDLCILSRVNRDVTQAASKKVFIPVARSYDGSDWHRVEGRYVSYVAVQCGQSAADGDGYSAGDYLCQLQVPQLNEGNVGYFLTKWEQGTATDTRQAARFLEKATWGAT
jgi:hypothetical protein